MPPSLGCCHSDWGLLGLNICQQAPKLWLEEFTKVTS